MDSLFRFLKKTPFFSDADFSRPEVRRKSLITVVGVLIALFFIAALAIRWVSSRSAVIDEDQPQQTTNLLEIPLASEDDEILASGSMSEARTRTRRPGLRDIYDEAVSEDETARDDALAAFLGEDLKEEQPSTDRDSVAEAADKPYITDMTGSALHAQHLIIEEPSAAEKPAARKAEPQRPARPKDDGIDAPQRRRRPAQIPDSPEQNERRRREAEASAAPVVVAETVVAETAKAEAPAKDDGKGAILVRKSGSISTLDDEWGSIDGLGGLDTDDMYIREDEDRPYRVMFTRDEKVSSGQRITLRTLDDIAVAGMLIPRNTHLSAVISIGERLSISVNSIEIGSKIYQLNLIGYDNDGNVGLYCPATESNQTAQQLANAASSAPIGAIGSVIGTATGGVGGTIIGSAIGNAASQALTTGATAVTRKGVTSVKINAGYVFFLLKDN